MQNDKRYSYDVFISYRWITPDKEWVREQLHPALLNAGLKVCLDVEDFLPGRDLVLEMERAGQESNSVLCIITPEYFEEGRMVEFESLSARRRDPGGRDGFLIPLVLRETKLPERIEALIPIIWLHPKDVEREWRKLLKALNAPNLAANPPLLLETRRTVDSAKLAFLSEFPIRDFSDLQATVNNLIKKSEDEPLNQYERALIVLHDAARRRRKEALDLSNEELRVLPREIGIFKNLTELNLEGNNISVLPGTIGKLSRLKRLYLQGNGLSHLPLELGSLGSLERLMVQNNALSDLPFEIGKLTNLRELDLSNNRLRTLPSSITKLAGLRELCLQGNHIPLPPEILGRSPSDLISFVLQVTTQDARSLSEAKVLVVGQGGVGKTSLVKRMIEGEFNEFEPKTEGILIKNWHWNVSGRWIRTNFWDFGGQEIMHATHQFFLTQRSLYILVWDARQEDNYGELDYWLNIIQSFGGDAPVIVVLNKTDVGATEIDRRGLKHKFPNIKAFVNSSCKTGSGIAELKDHVGWHVYQLPHTTTVWPPKWFMVKSQLEQANKDYISLTEYDSLCSKADIEPVDRGNLLQFLHDLGIVLSFHDDARLCDTNVLNPEWATGGVYGILNDKQLFGKGILEMNDLSRILDGPRYPLSKHGFIINIMQKFELCYQIDDKDKTRFLIPDLLTKQQPFFKWDFTFSLAFQYHYNFLPSSVISRFIVRMHSFIDKELVWRTGVVLRDGKNRALVKSDKTARKIFIYIDGPKNTRRDLLSKIRSNFEHIHRTISKVVAAAKVPLPENHDIVVDYQHLINLEALGERMFIPEGMKRKVEIGDFLWGIEEAASRSVGNREAEQKIDVADSQSSKVGPQLQAASQPSSNLGQISIEVSRKIAEIPPNAIKLKRQITELQVLIEEDIVLPDHEKVISLKKVGLLAEFACIPVTEESIEQVVRVIKGTIVEGSTVLFESGKELLDYIYRLLTELGNPR